MTIFNHIDTLIAAKEEVINLRRYNDLLNAKLQGIEMAMTFLRATPSPNPSMMAISNVVRDIDNAVATLQQK